MSSCYSKADVETHSDGPYRSLKPAVNVKAYRFPSNKDTAKHFDCTEEQADRALRRAFEMHQERFWEDAQEIAERTFPFRVEVYAEGRSDGWAVVDALTSTDGWNAIDLAHWRSFEVQLHALRDYLCSKSAVFETIEAALPPATREALHI